MEALLISTGVVALAEMGDKTQLLAFLLAARFKKPLPIVLGILAATILNHGMAGAAGTWIASYVRPDVLRWLLGLGFLAMAAWVLLPDKMDDHLDLSKQGHWGVFSASFISFFLAEMGDKTQIATIAMAAHYPQPIWVVAGTTLGMLIADVPAVFLGNRFAAKIPMRLVHGMAAVIFALLGLAVLITYK